MTDSDLQRILSIADEHLDQHLIEPNMRTLKHMSDVFCGSETGMNQVGRQHFHWLCAWALENEVAFPSLDYILTTYYLAFVYYNYKLSQEALDD